MVGSHSRCSKSASDDSGRAPDYRALWIAPSTGRPQPRKPAPAQTTPRPARQLVARSGHVAPRPHEKRRWPVAAPLMSPYGVVSRALAAKLAGPSRRQNQQPQTFQRPFKHQGRREKQNARRPTNESELPRGRPTGHAAAAADPTQVEPPPFDDPCHLRPETASG